MSSDLFEIKAKSNQKYGIYNEISESIKEYEKKYNNGKELSKKETLSFLFGDFSNHPETKLDICIRIKPTSTVANRLNQLWAYPLTLVLAPFRYVLFGYTGWDDKTLIGRFMLHICGQRPDKQWNHK